MVNQQLEWNKIISKSETRNSMIDGMEYLNNKKKITYTSVVKPDSGKLDHFRIEFKNADNEQEIKGLYDIAYRYLHTEINSYQQMGDLNFISNPVELATAISNVWKNFYGADAAVVVKNGLLERFKLNDNLYVSYLGEKNKQLLFESKTGNKLSFDQIRDIIGLTNLYIGNFSKIREKLSKENNEIYRMYMHLVDRMNKELNTGKKADTIYKAIDSIAEDFGYTEGEVSIKLSHRNNCIYAKLQRYNGKMENTYKLTDEGLTEAINFYRCAVESFK